MGNQPSASRPKGPAKARRALTHVGGAAQLQGDLPSAKLLADALDVPSAQASEDAARLHVHGFHSYPARMHPVTAHRVVEVFSQPGQRLLDPFCGSGTVIVEARLLGRVAFGVDINPLAVRLSRLKARGSTKEWRDKLVVAAQQVASIADQRRKQRVGASCRYLQQDVVLFAPHVLLELDSLRVGLDSLADRPICSDLELVLSAILTKVSSRTSDTSEEKLVRRIAAGYPTRLFVQKTQELAARLEEVADKLAEAPAWGVFEGDARVLHDIKPASIDLVITSPPYPGVYDYLVQHQARLRWLRLRSDVFAQGELGARRRLHARGGAQALIQWKNELGEVFAAISQVLRPKATMILLLADGVVGGTAVFALDLLQQVLSPTGLVLQASASQVRPYFHGPTARAFGQRPRSEHAVILIKHHDPVAVNPSVK